MIDQLSKAERNLIFKLQTKLDAISPALVESVAKEFLEKATPPKQIENKEKDPGGESAGDTLMIDGRTTLRPYRPLHRIF